MQLFSNLSSFSLNQLNNKPVQPVLVQPPALLAGLKPQPLNVDTFEPASTVAKTRSGWNFPSKLITEVHLGGRRVAPGDVTQGLGQAAYIFREVFAKHKVLGYESDHITDEVLKTALRHFTEVCGLHNPENPIASKEGLAAIIFSHPDLVNNGHFRHYFNTNSNSVEVINGEGADVVLGRRPLKNYLDPDVIERIHAIAKQAMRDKNMGIGLNSDQHKKLVGNLGLALVVDHEFRNSNRSFPDWLGAGLDPDTKLTLPNSNDFYLAFMNFRVPSYVNLSTHYSQISCELHAIPMNSVSLKKPKEADVPRVLLFPTCVDTNLVLTPNR
jgi:hypothetical protein